MASEKENQFSRHSRGEKKGKWWPNFQEALSIDRNSKCRKIRIYLQGQQHFSTWLTLNSSSSSANWHFFFGSHSTRVRSKLTSRISFTWRRVASRPLTLEGIDQLLERRNCSVGCRLEATIQIPKDKILVVRFKSIPTKGRKKEGKKTTSDFSGQTIDFCYIGLTLN